ncbi:hypothetical protein [Lichenibacterium dinghuense]|uniref:hypothetical protein n=1 Tax=Lichenibacterium dinghuense TaxID=2895977 RepID=UPI001F264883|nr:hypothetical protein [Lichenibacterium sp. 6Y81]
MLSFDAERLAHHQKREREALSEVAAVIAGHGFTEAVPGFYVGSGDVDAVRAVVAVQDVAEALSWFAPCLRSARLLRIEEDGDLTIALM